MRASEKLIRATRSVCSVCLKPVPARVVEDGGSVWLRKSCSEDGETECLLSRHAWYYGGLDRYFFSLMDRPFPQRDYMLRMTERCNLQCPICLAAALPQAMPAPPSTNLELDDSTLDGFLVKHRGKKVKIDLISAEPTLRPDLPDLIRRLKQDRHIVALHTNGIRLANRDYLKSLMDAGLDEVHLQMDGFDDEAYLKIRGTKLASNKRKVLENLDALDVATDLVMVIMPDTNEDEIPGVLDYTLKHTFVRELFFLGTRPLGFFKENENLLMPDQVIDLVDERTHGLLNRRAVYRFQKLYFALLKVLGIRKCLYNQHYMLMRNGSSWMPIEALFDWSRLERLLDELPRVGRSPWKKLAWGLKMAWTMSTARFLRYVPDFLSMVLHLKLGWDLSGLPRRVLLVGYITACDPVNMDYEVARHCGKGEVSMDVGTNESSAHANVERERNWREDIRVRQASGHSQGNDGDA